MKRLVRLRTAAATEFEVERVDAERRRGAAPATAARLVVAVDRDDIVAEGERLRNVEVGAESPEVDRAQVDRATGSGTRGRSCAPGWPRRRRLDRLHRRQRQRIDLRRRRS